MVWYDRRRSHRVQPAEGWAQPGGEAQEGRFRVVDLSLGGALLYGATPSLRLGERVLLGVQVGQAPPLDVLATIVRTTTARSGETQVAAEFEVQDKQTHDALAEVLVREQARQRRRAVLVHGRVGALDDTLRRYLGDLGFVALEAPTPLELVHYLGHPAYDVVAVLLAPDGPGMAAPEVASFLGERHTGVRRILMSGTWRTPVPGTETVDAVVRMPWNRSELQRALERSYQS